MRGVKPKTLLAITAALLFGITASVHHSFDATYQLDREVKIEGKIVQSLIRNPHSFLHIQAPDDAGVLQSWSVEWQSAGKLGKQGVQRDRLQAGDEVTIMMNPGRRPGEHRGVLTRLSRKSDGFEWAGQRKKARAFRYTSI
jgi:hypothetical protein